MKQKYLFLFMASLFAIFKINAQDPSNTTTEIFHKKNAIYGSIGVGALYFSATGYYERALWAGGDKFYYTAFGRAAYGGYALWGAGGSLVLVEGGMYTGRKNSYLELALGYNSYLQGDWKGERPLGVSAGYRFQKPDGLFIFRTCIGLPEAIFVSVGIGF